jgi:hypothetical protein
MQRVDHHNNYQDAKQTKLVNHLNQVPSMAGYCSKYDEIASHALQEFAAT